MKHIFPLAKVMHIEEQTLDIPGVLFYKSNPIADDALSGLTHLETSYQMSDADHQPHLIFKIDERLELEAYRLSVNQKGITIEHGTKQGAFYALMTLKQLELYRGHRFQYAYIEDEPELKFRGVLLDISRNKVPKKDFLQGYIDFLAELKYNQLYLYVEGMSYLYPSFKELYDDKQSYITPQEYKAIEKYASDHMIDLIPCHNGLGHMHQWLEKFPELKITDSGIVLNEEHHVPSTLNPLNEKSLEFVQTLYQDAIKNSKSAYFHMNLDEPYELGYGKTKEISDQVGIGTLYLEYVNQLSSFVKQKKKTPMMWADVINQHPELISKLPKDIIYIDWGYDFDYPFYKTLRRLSEAHLNFIAAPGTSSWNSFSGRHDNMIENISQAAIHVRENQGLGLLITDWGDRGHLQMNSSSLLGLVFGGLEAWRHDTNNRYYMMHYLEGKANDSFQKLGRLLLDLGNYFRFEDSFMHNQTLIVKVIDAALHLKKDDVQASTYHQLCNHPYGTNAFYRLFETHMKDIKHRHAYARYMGPFGRELRDEIEASIYLLDAMVKLIRLMHKDCDESEYNEISNDLLKKYQQALVLYKKISKKSYKMESLQKTFDILDSIGLMIEKSIMYDYKHRNPKDRKPNQVYDWSSSLMN